jgi:hypothetical protein
VERILEQLRQDRSAGLPLVAFDQASALLQFILFYRGWAKFGFNGI